MALIESKCGQPVFTAQFAIMLMILIFAMVNLTRGLPCEESKDYMSLVTLVIGFFTRTGIDASFAAYQRRKEEAADIEDPVPSPRTSERGEKVERDRILHHHEHKSVRPSV